MGFRFSAKLLPGVRVTLGASGPRVSIGPRGLTATVGKRGVTTTVGIPGTGVSFSSTSPKSRAQFKAPAEKHRTGQRLRARQSRPAGNLYDIGGTLPTEPRRVAPVARTPLTCPVCDYERRPADHGPLGCCPACRVGFSDLSQSTRRRPSTARRRARRVLLGLVVLAAAAGGLVAAVLTVLA
jgi:hypothetical protein